MKSLPFLWIACGLAMACSSCDKKDEASAAQPKGMTLEERAKSRKRNVEARPAESKAVNKKIALARFYLDLMDLDPDGDGVADPAVAEKLQASRLALADDLGHGKDPEIMKAFKVHDERLEGLKDLREALARVDRAVTSHNAAVSRLHVAQQNLSEAMAAEPLSDEQKLEAYVSSGISGIPQSVSQEIVRKGKQERYTFSAVRKIEEEATAYLAVEEFRKGSGAMPSAVRNEILAGAEREHPGDWYWMSKKITEQSEAWATLDKWRRSSVPGLTPAQSKVVLAEAMGRYPKDWSMALFVVDGEAKKVER